MRKQHLVGILLVIAGVAGILAPVSAQMPFTIRRPRNGAVVREKVRVEVPKASIPGGSFVAFAVDGDFRVATVPANDRNPVVTFVWDTRSRATDLKLAQSMEDKYTKEGYPKEGPHTIQAILYDVQGQQQAESSVNVIVRNTIANPPRQPVRLAYRFQLDEEVNYAYRLSGQLRDMGNEPLGQNSQITVEAKWLQRTEDINEGWAILTQKFTPDSMAMVLNPTPNRLSIADQRVFVQMKPKGLTEIGRASAGKGYFLVYYPIDLKPTPARVGDSWRGVVRLMTDPDTGTARSFPATHTLVGYEWQQGLQCARIESTFKGVQPILQRMASAGTSTIDVEGERTTYFSPKLGRVVKSVDTIRGSASLPPGAVGGMPGAGPGGGMTPGGGMRPGGGMGPSGGGPGMGPGGGMPGMGPGGGMPGMGGGMMGGMMRGGMRQGGGMPGMGPGGGMRPGGGMPGMGPGGAGGATPAPASEPVQVKFDVTATLEMGG